jgi:hypothetical protein
MNPNVLELVQTAPQILESVEHFNAGAPANLARARRLLSGTTYWVYVPDTNTFGPGKFVGFQGMNFETYDAALKGKVDDDTVFDGHRTRVAIEAAVGGQFADRPELASKLEAWGEALAGSAAFGNSERAKWRFIELPFYSY